MLSTIDIEGKTVLDVGVQDKPSSRLTYGTPKKYLTLDIDPQWKPDLVADLNEIGGNAYTFEKLKELDIDIIFCIEVLEHCWNPIVALGNLHEFLKKGGDLYISTPFINPHHDVVDYLRYTDEWYREVLPRVGFEVKIIKERRASAGLGLLKQFYEVEYMKYSKIRQKNGPYTYPVGYFVHAKKI